MYISGRLATSKVVAAQIELLSALRDAIRASDDLTRDFAEASLSNLYCSLWNDSEKMLGEMRFLPKSK